MTDPETFWSLLHNAAHWEFEIFLMVVFDGIVGALLYPWASKHIKHHLLRDRRELIKGVRPLTFEERLAKPPVRKTRQIFTYDDIVSAYSATPPASEEFNQPPKSKFDWLSEAAALKLRQPLLPIYVQMTDEEIVRLCRFRRLG